MASEALIGRAIEYLVAATVVLAGDARLNVMTAIADDEGVDLVFRRRGGDVTLAVQVKGRRTTSSVLRMGVFQQEVRKATFRPRPALFVLFVAVDGNRGAIERAWFVPSVDFCRLANEVAGGTKLRLRASTGSATKDKWATFRVDPSALAARIEAVLDKLEEAGRVGRGPQTDGTCN